MLNRWLVTLVLLTVAAGLVLSAGPPPLGAQLGGLHWKYDSGTQISPATGLSDVSIPTGITLSVASALKLADGTVALPSLTFVSDPDTGLYSLGANRLGFATAGVNAMEITAAQSVLIPTSVQVADGTVSVPSITFINDPDTGIYRLGANRLAFTTGTNKGMEITAAQSVLIPTSVNVGTVGTAITQIRVYSQTITPGSVATIVCAEQTFTVTGLTTTDKVLYNPPATGNATSAAQVRVSATDTLAVMYCNPTAGALTPGAGTATIVAFRS